MSYKFSDKHKVYFLLSGMVLIPLFLLIVFLWSESLTSNNVSKSLYRDYAPVITAENGFLTYNSVRIKVPKTGASYTVGYDWAREDKDYPSVPSSATVLYSNDGGQPAYEVVLYRDKVVQKDLRSTSNGEVLKKWFDGWDSTSDSYVKQQPYEAPTTSGFLVSTHREYGEGAKEYCSYTYYFVIETVSSFEQYVVDFRFFDSDSINNAEGIFKAFTDGITID